MSTAAASSANANIPPTGGNAAGNANFQPAPANTFGAIKQRVLWIGFAMLGRYAISEYGEWKSFGTGSIEPSIKEYAKMNLLRIQNLVTMHDPLKVDHLETHPDTTAYLTALPVREGVKGSMLGRPLPQRERLLKEAYDYKEESLKAFERIAESHSGNVRRAESVLEAGGPALFVTQSDNPACQRVQNEVAHLHDRDYALHVLLSPRDAATAISRGWGVKYPTSEHGDGYIFVHAPSDAAQSEGVKSIIEAAIAYCSK